MRNNSASTGFYFHGRYYPPWQAEIPRTIPRTSADLAPTYYFKLSNPENHLPGLREGIALAELHHIVDGPGQYLRSDDLRSKILAGFRYQRAKA